MSRPTAVLLSVDDMQKIKAAREKTELSQTAVAIQAWPHLKEPSAKSMWARMETNAESPIRVDMLTPAIEVLGLELSGTLKVKAVNA